MVQLGSPGRANTWFPRLPRAGRPRASHATRCRWLCVREVQGSAMGRVYGEPVQVQVREDGRPTGFAWCGRRYTVTAVQEYWLVNRDWWRESSPLPARPELEFWRVEAGDPVGTYELRKDIAAGTWTLRGIAD